MGTYFTGIKTTAGATRRWRSLAKKHHPDVGGDQNVMAAINAEYHEILERLRTPAERKPNLHDAYEPQERDPLPQRRKAAREKSHGGLADLLSDEEITDVADTLATTASKIVGLGVRAFARKVIARRRST